VGTKPAKEFKLHPLGGLGAFSDFPCHIRAWGEVVLEDRLPRASHVSKDGLFEVPSKELVQGPAFVVQETAIKGCTGEPIKVSLEVDDLIVILVLSVTERGKPDGTRNGSKRHLHRD
jgi:hypothetical protein